MVLGGFGCVLFCVDESPFESSSPVVLMFVVVEVFVTEFSSIFDHCGFKVGVSC